MLVCSDRFHRRIAEATPKEQAWDAQAIAEIKGTPWRPDPGRNGSKIPTMINHGEDNEQEEEDTNVVIGDEEVIKVEVQEPNTPKM